MMLERTVGTARRWAVWAAAVAISVSPGLAAAGETPRGHVDASRFIELVGEEAVTVQVSLGAPLLSALAAFDPELHELVGGLESIHAVILDLSGSGAAERARGSLARTEKELAGRGWQRLALVREKDAEVRVLLLNDDQKIEGLLVMVVDFEDAEMVVANLAGVLDLARLRAVGESLEIPGLDRLPQGAGD